MRKGIVGLLAGKRNVVAKRSFAFSRAIALPLLTLLLAHSLTHCLYSATPSKIKYQGVLKEKGVLVNGAKTMKFRITNSDGATAYWDSGNVSVTATQGAFSYELEPTGITWQTGGYYLEVTIGGQLLSPREEIASTVYALQSKKVDSVPWTDITDKPAGFADGTDAGETGALASTNTITNTTTDPALSILQSGATNAILIQSDNAPAIQVTAGGLLFNGNTGAIPMEGPGTRLMWYPAKYAFRAGYVGGAQWDDVNIGEYSTAMGYYTTASKIYSTAMGRATTASGSASTAMGWNTIASGLYSTAMGFCTIASGNFSTAMGYYTTASGAASTAMGKNVTNNIANSFMVGFNATPTFTVFADSVTIAGSAGATTDVLVISTGTKNLFRFQANGVAKSHVSFDAGGADYAEWFEKEENGIKPGDIVGLNNLTGKARKYVAGDVLIGICSSNPGFVGNRPINATDEEMKEKYVLVGLVGQLTVDVKQIDIVGRKVLTKDEKQVGYLLSNGKVLLKM